MTKLLPLLFLNIIQELQDRVGKAMDSNEEMIKIRKEIVDFHGEMVLLENYSALNFTGTIPSLTFSFLLFDKFSQIRYDNSYNYIFKIVKTKPPNLLEIEPQMSIVTIFIII